MAFEVIRFMNLKRLIITAFLFLAALVLITALIAPNTFQIEKSIMIEAPSDLIYYHIHSQDSAQTRPPWLNADTLYFNAFERGKEKIFLSRQNCITKVKWNVMRHYAFPLNAFATVMPVKRKMETRVENRLDALKIHCEEDVRIIESYQIRNIRFPAARYAAVREQVNFTELHDFYTESIELLYDILNSKNARITGVPCLFIFSADENSLAEVAAAIPFAGDSPEGIEILEFPVMSGYELDFMGSYDHIHRAYFALNSFYKKENADMPSAVMEAFIQKNDSAYSHRTVKIIFFVP